MSKSGAANLPAFKTSVRKSVNRTSASAGQTRSAANASVDASPLLRGHKRKQKDDLPNSPPIKRMANCQDLAAALTGITARLDKIDKGLKVNATKEDVTKVQTTLTQLHQQMNNNKENIEWIMQARRDDAKKVEHRIEECVREEIGKLSTERPRGNRMDEILKVEEMEYNEARRSTRMWPIPDGDESVEKSVRDFMCSALQMPRLEVARIQLEFARRVSGARRSKINDEVLVKFRDTGDRDAVQSYAPNLANMAGKAGIRLEVPTHLRRVFRLLESHGGELKKAHPSVKRAIKFDDASRSLVLDVKINEGEGWMRVDPEMAEESKRIRGKTPNSSSLRACPGGKARRRVLMLPSPGKENVAGFEATSQAGWRRQRGSSADSARSSERNE